MGMASAMIILFMVGCALGLHQAHAQSLGCAITADDWTKIHSALQQRYYYSALEPEGYCSSNSSNSFIVRYGSCTSLTLEQALAAQNVENNCQGFLATRIYTGEGVTELYDQVNARTREICASQSLALAIRGVICNPLRTVGCPRQLDIIKFAVFEKCHSGLFGNWTLAQQTEYFQKREDRECMIRNNVCKDLQIWNNCPVIVNQVFDFIDESRKYTCANIFPSVQSRCLDTYKTNHELYCPPPTILEANFYTIVVTCTVGPVALIALFFCYKLVYRAYHISSDEVIQQAREMVDPTTGQSIKIFHPELAAVVESKYKGVSFNPQTGMWSVAGKAERFEDEQAAARFAYLNLANQPSKSAQSTGSSYSTPRSGIVSNDFPVSAAYQSETEYVVNAVPLSPEQIKQRRLQQLIAFYEYWEPTKSDIPAHAENLLNRHDFEHVARAVKTKYGVLPPGWAEELEV